MEILIIMSVLTCAFTLIFLEFLGFSNFSHIVILLFFLSAAMVLFVLYFILKFDSVCEPGREKLLRNIYLWTNERYSIKKEIYVHKTLTQLVRINLVEMTGYCLTSEWYLLPVRELGNQHLSNSSDDLILPDSSNDPDGGHDSSWLQHRSSCSLLPPGSSWLHSAETKSGSQ